MRPIDADALRKWFDNYYDSEKFTVAHICNMIEDMPTIEGITPTHVVNDGNPFFGKCPECGEDINVNWNFCSNCGVKMEGNYEIR